MNLIHLRLVGVHVLLINAYKIAVQHSCSIDRTRTKEEQRSVNHFLCSEGVKTGDIYGRVTV
jgi:hypothetical protein